MCALTIDLPADEFQEQVVAQAARQMLQRYVYDEDGNQGVTSSELARRIENTIADAIREQARKAAPKVAEEVLERGTQKTNNWGDPDGPKVPLSTVIAEEVYRHLRDGQTGRSGPGVLELMLKREVERALREELHEALDEARAKVVAAVKDEATKALAKAIDDTLPAVKF